MYSSEDVYNGHTSIKKSQPFTAETCFLPANSVSTRLLLITYCHEFFIKTSYITFMYLVCRNCIILFCFSRVYLYDLLSEHSPSRGNILYIECNCVFM